VATRPDSEAIAKSREAMRLKMNEVIAHEPAAPAYNPAQPGSSRHEAVSAAEQAAGHPAPAPSKKAKRAAPAFQPTTSFQPIQGPPLPISTEKQQKLADLLRRYQADQVTPSQYHEERAKILAEP
jgi:hypothetical protein